MVKTFFQRFHWMHCIIVEMFGEHFILILSLKKHTFPQMFIAIKVIEINILKFQVCPDIFNRRKLLLSVRIKSWLERQQNV